MIERGAGFVVNISSAVAWMDPPAPPGEGGWGLGYAMSKAALHRVVPSLHAELYGDGIVFLNIDPGYIATERMAADMADFGFDGSTGAPPGVIGAVVGWLTTNPEGAQWAGQVVPAQQLCADLGLVPGFAGPVPNPV
jgi:NAD(P)-dependent dehydrogenase (short-subunit alcohol dehydrogenase family)